MDGIRSYSLTAETEAHHLLFSWAASNKVRLKTGDISNAYFQGEEQIGYHCSNRQKTFPILSMRTEKL